MSDYSHSSDYDQHSAATPFAADKWQRSYLCEPNGGNCVEVNLGTDALGHDLVGVRDSKRPGAPAFAFDAAEWTAFVAAVKAGQFDLA